MSRGAPLLPYVLAFGIGIFAADALDVSAHAHLLTFGLILASFVFWRRGLRRPLEVSLCFAFFSLGIARWSDFSGGFSLPGSSPPNASAESAVYEGVVSSYPERTRWGYRAEVEVSNLGKARLSFMSENPPSRGSMIRFSSRLRSPRNFGNDREWDYELYGRSRGIRWIGSVSGSDRWVEVFPARSTIQSSLNVLRSEAIEQADLYLSPPHRGLFRSLVLGESGSIDSEILESFRKSGVMHLLVVSGSHYAVIAALFGLIAGWLWKRSRRAVQFSPVAYARIVGGLVGVLLFASLTNVPIPSLRAIGLVLLAMMGLFLQRGVNGWSVAAFSAGFLLAWTPSLLFDPSFQLTFLAVGGILWALDLFPPRGKGKWGVALIVVAIGAFLATLPAIAAHFGRVSLWAIVGNVLFVPVIGGVATPLGLVAALTAILPGPISGMAFSILDQGLTWTLPSLHFVARLPGTDLWIPPPTWATAFAWLLMMALFWMRKRLRQPRPAFLALSVISVALLFVGDKYRNLREGDEVHFFHVGQGDSTLILTKEGGGVLIDTGPGGLSGMDAGERVVVPWLRSHGIDTIELLVLTHSDLDHVGGALALLRAVEVREIWFPSVETSSYVAEIREVARSRGILWKEIDKKAEDRVVGKSLLRVLGPNVKNQELASDNDRSIVLLLENRAGRILFSADIEAAGEADLISRNEPIRAEILKVPHHGSQTSSTSPFLRRVRPQLGVIQCGFENRYHHPSPRVENRLRSQGIRTLRGDECGEIVVHFSSAGWAVASMRSCEIGL